MDEDSERDAPQGTAKLEDEGQISPPPKTTPEIDSILGDDTSDNHQLTATKFQNSELSQSKKKDEDFVRDERKGKAKLEGEDLISLPPNPSPEIQTNLGFDTVYLKFVGPVREPEAVETESPESVKKVQFRFRNKEIHRILGKDDDKITKIHTVSGATIGIISDTQAMIHRHLYLELVGTADEVKIAEVLITDAITEAYERPYVPIALMPTNICHHAIPVLITQVVALLGMNDTNVLKMESETGTWIEVDTLERVVNVYGQELDVSKASLMVTEWFSEYERSINAINEVVAEEIGSSCKMEDEFQKDEFGNEEGDGELGYDAEDDEM